MELVSGNIFIREGRLERAGDFIEGHYHAFDHTTYVPKGSIRFEVIDENGKVLKSVYKSATEPRNWVLIKANAKHRLTALEDDSRYHCIYSHRNPKGDIVEEYDGWIGAYS